MDIDIERLKWDAEYWDEVAPEGATHYANGIFRKLTDGRECVFTIYGDWGCCLHSWPSEKYAEHWGFIPRPTKPAAPEWDGSGRPNIGDLVSHPRYGDPCTLRWIGKASCVIESNFGDEYFAAIEDLEPFRTQSERDSQQIQEIIRLYPEYKAEDVEEMLRMKFDLVRKGE